MSKYGIKIFFQVIIGSIALSSLAYALPAPDLKQSNDVINKLLNLWASGNYNWKCTLVDQKSLNKNETVKWSKWSCQGSFPKNIPQIGGGSTGLLTINIVDTDLTDAGVTIKPLLADAASLYTQTLSDMAKSRPDLIAAINGGYFFINEPKFTDSNCPKKKYPQPATTQNIGDGVLTIDGVNYSVNCGELGPISSPRATIIQDAQNNWSIQNIGAETVPGGIIQGLGAGPAMIDKGKIAMDWQQIPSTFEYAANTAVSLAKDNNQHTHLQLFTVDGVDNEAGMISYEMTNFIYTQYPKLFHLNVTQAMSMDQGGSTTLYVDGNIVSKSDAKGKLRPVYDALGIFLNN